MAVHYLNRMTNMRRQLERIIDWNDAAGITTTHVFDPRATWYTTIEWPRCVIKHDDVPVLDGVRDTVAEWWLDVDRHRILNALVDEITRRWQVFRFAVPSALKDVLLAELERNSTEIRDAALEERQSRRAIEWWYTKRESRYRVIWTPYSLSLPMSYLVSVIPVKPAWLDSGPIPLVPTISGVLAVRPRLAFLVALVISSGPVARFSTDTVENVPVFPSLGLYIFENRGEYFIGADVVMAPLAIINSVRLSDAYPVIDVRGRIIQDAENIVVGDISFHPNGPVYRNLSRIFKRGDNDTWLFEDMHVKAVANWRTATVLELGPSHTPGYRYFALIADPASPAVIKDAVAADCHYIALQYMRKARISG
jgi:hypothetical protein